MTEALRDTDLTQGILHVQTNAIDPPASEILEGLDGLQSMEAYAISIEAARKKFLDSRIMDNGQSIVGLSEFGGSRPAYYRTVAKVGRKPHRDRYELLNTSLKVVSVLAKLHRPNFVYAKTREQTRGEGPQYTLGKITGALVAVEPDHPKVPLENRVVVRIKTPSQLDSEGEKETPILVDDIAAQFEKHGGGNTGVDTPIVAVGKRAVRGFVQRAYLEPRAERKACGNDSCDIFAALNESGTRLIDLGFRTEHIELLRAQVIAGLKRVCSLRATYNHEILMLPPLCDSLEEAMAIIDQICGNRAVDDILPELADEYRLLAALCPR